MKNLLFPCNFLASEFKNDFINEPLKLGGSLVFANLYLIASHIIVVEDENAPAYMANVDIKLQGEIIAYVGKVYDASKSPLICGYIERHPTLFNILSISNLINQIKL